MAKSKRRPLRKTPKPDLETAYPIIAEYVRGQGHIEIGDQEGEGFVARAIDYGGMIFETQKANILTQAMAALEKGIAKYLEEHG